MTGAATARGPDLAGGGAGQAKGSAVQYETVAGAYRDLERAGGRLALIDRLGALLARTPAEMLPTVCYLCQGLVALEFAGVDLGLAEKLAVRAVATATATATGAGPGQVAASVRETGDLGQAAEQGVHQGGLAYAELAEDREPESPGRQPRQQRTRRALPLRIVVVPGDVHDDPQHVG
jgi:hypothetical protein